MVQSFKTSFNHKLINFQSLASITSLRENIIGWTFNELPIKFNSQPTTFLTSTNSDCVENNKVAEVNKQFTLDIENVLIYFVII